MSSVKLLLNKKEMNVLKRFGKTALDAASSTLNYITPKVIKNKLRAFTNWVYDYVGRLILTQFSMIPKTIFKVLVSKNLTLTIAFLEKTTHP